MESTSQNTADTPNARFVYDQLRQDCLVYNEAVGSFNRHLGNHRERMDLTDIPYREPVRTPSNRRQMRTLLDRLLDEVHLDSLVRRHPRTVPIHEEALEHVELARSQLIRTLETELPAD